eukprot:gene38133-47067_t
MKFSELGLHNTTVCPDALVDCPLFEAKCCGVDCSGTVKRCDYQQHLKDNTNVEVTTQLVKRLHES